MKAGVIAACMLFLVALAGTGVMCWSGNSGHESWFAVGFAIMTLLSVMVMINGGMRYVLKLLVESDKILSQEKKYSKWSFNNLIRLQQNQTLLHKKFETTANLIANLSSKEMTGEGPANDAIGKALQNIRTEMVRIKDEEDKRAWINEGLARFSEVLRSKTEIADFGNQIIGNLVKYTNANQGSLFVEYENAEGARYLQLTACYAYEKRKYLEGKVFEGQGLLGQCMLEKDFLFLTDVPKDYIKITSGLGYATPRNIVVAPLMVNDVFCGAIELAFFEVMKPHQVQFLKRVCEDIASEIASIKSIQQTQVLLEESNALTKELQSREEETKQNLEKLATAQNEMAHQQAELSGIINAIDITLATAEFDLTGNVKGANDIFLKVMGFELAELTGKNYDFLMGHDQTVVMMWENLRLGKSFSGEFRMKDKTGRAFWLTGTFNPIVVSGDAPKKIVMFAQFTTQEKEKMSDLNGMVHALKLTLPVIEFNDQFSCKTANDKAMKIFGVSRLELRNKTILDFISPYYHFAWKKKAAEVLTDEFSNIILPLVTPDREISYEVTLSVIRNPEGRVTKVVVILVKEVKESVSVLAAM
ncbi:PAS domain S-box-containing protein [Chryseolinea serpens]|uniref:PAS domain S-box-containing protein n=1 Tax=Chryseolinea serpens TaxID=947013 RepID=A0A1M5X251_9BACT|nr:PAS domain-containing protein [Chryseolinea serpens]SHH93889.1 PAS domain S-box-containing protein [Chryseolinea serpens]